MESKYVIIFIVFCLATANCGLVNWFQEWSENLDPNNILGNRNKCTPEDVLEEIKITPLVQNTKLGESEESDKIVSLLDIDEQNNGNHVKEIKKHSKRCPGNRIKITSPNFHKVGDSSKSTPVVGIVKRGVPETCESCRKNPICTMLKECTGCTKICSVESDNQVIDSSKPFLSNRFAETIDGDLKMYPFANFSDGAEKEIICRILNIKDTKDIDTVFIFMTTKSNNPPLSDKPSTLAKNEQEDNTESNTSPALKPRFGEDYDYESAPAFLPEDISPSQSRKNPDVIEGPPPKIGSESPLIVEPEALNDSDSDETSLEPAESEEPEPLQTSSAVPEFAPRSGLTNLSALPAIKELTEKQEQHLKGINNAIKEAKEMIQSIQNQAKIADQPISTLASNNPIDTANTNNLNSVFNPNSLKEAVPPHMKENLKKVNDFFLNRAQDALDMINDNKKENQNTGVLGSSNSPENPREEESEITKKLFQDFKKMPQLILNRIKDNADFDNPQNYPNNKSDIVGQSQKPEDSFASKIKTNEISTKPIKDMFKSKLQKYLDNLKKQKETKSIIKTPPLAHITENTNTPTNDLAIPYVANANNVEEREVSQMPEDNITKMSNTLSSTTSKAPLLFPNVEEKLKKEREVLKNKLKKYTEEQKLKNKEKAAKKESEKMVKIKDEEKSLKAPQKTTDMFKNIQNEAEAEKDVLKERFNKFVNGLKSGPIKNDLKALNTLQSTDKTVATEKNEKSTNLNNRNAAVQNNLTEQKAANPEVIVMENTLTPNLGKIKGNTDQLKEKLRQFIDNNQNKLKQALPKPSIKMLDLKNDSNQETIDDNINQHLPNETENTEPVVSTIETQSNKVDDTGADAANINSTPSETPNLLKSRNNLLDNSLLEQNFNKFNTKDLLKKLKPTDFLEKLKEANDDITKALRIKHIELPKLTTAPPMTKIELITPTQKISNDERKAKLRAKLQEYVNSLQNKAPKVSTPENHAADKYGKGLLSALKESEKKLKAIDTNEVEPKIGLKNRLQKFMDTVKAEKSNGLNEDTSKILGSPQETLDFKDPDAVNLKSKGNFVKEDTLTPWTNSLGKIVKSPENELFFIGEGIKLPLRMATNPDNTIDLSVDLDKLCSCNSSCPKNSADIEQTVGVILEKEAELQKEINLNNSAELKTALGVKTNMKNTNKRKRSPKINEERDNNLLTHENSNKNLKKASQKTAAPDSNDNNKLTKHNLQNDKEPLTLDNLIKNPTDDFKLNIEKEKAILQRFNKKLNQDLTSKFKNLMEKTPESNSLSDPLKNFANDLKARFAKETAFINKFNNKLSKENENLKSKVDYVLDKAQDTILDPYNILEKKIKTLNNKIEKEHQKQEEMLAEKSKIWIGNKDIDKAVKEEVSIMEKMHNWFRSLKSEV